MYTLTASTQTTMVTNSVVTALHIKRRHLSLRSRFRSAFVFSSTTRAPSLQPSPGVATSTSGVPSAVQKASASPA